MVRYRRSLIQERAREHNRVQKVLEGANIKLAAVATDIMGLSGRDMMNAMINGEEDPEKLASFARGVMKKKKEELELSLRGKMSAHQRLMLKTMLTHVDFLNEQITDLDAEVAKRLDPFQEDIDRLDTIPGIARRTAEQILAEIGTNVGSRFPSAATFARGSVLCQDTTKVPVNENPRKLAKETNISDRHFLKLHNPYADLTIISEPYTGESQHAKVVVKRLLLLHTPS
ncbi:transposase [Paenibacillus sp. V4I3]|nr:transposase [Paenibacillus sp. V4I3]